jgi:uncharacterized membrane protein
MSSSVSLSNAKTLGGIGSILVLLTIFPTVGWILGIVGFVMILVAVKYIADSVKEQKIFNSMITAVVTSILGIAVGSLVVLATVLNAFSRGYFSSAYPFTPSAAVTLAQWITFGTEIGVGLFAAWILFVVSAVFLRRSYNAIGSKLNVHMFSTAGLLYLIGAATTVIGVGFLILFVTEILTAVAFFSIPERSPVVIPPQTIPTAV